jgi:hypothetical protein
MYRFFQHLTVDRVAAVPGTHRGQAVSARRRRRLVQSLRAVADRPLSRAAGNRRFEILLRDRAVAVRVDLLELADLLERSDDPDPRCVADLEKLVSDGCGSPLYNAAVHPSELSATLYYARAWLEQPREVSA